MSRVRVAVVGCGAFGTNHARVYAQLPEAELVGVYDRDAARAVEVARQFGTVALASLDEVKQRAEAVTIAVPTVAHAATGLDLMTAGLDVLVEKPIAPSLEEADALLDCARRHGRILQVGHLERFNPCVRLIRPRVTRPLFFEVHRLSLFTPRSLDVDVLLDLMIHDLDIVLSFVQSPIEEMRAVGLPVLTPHVDIANVRMTFANGCVANLTASRVSTEKVRKLRFFQPGEYISLDYTRQDARVFALQTGAANAAAAAMTGGLAIPGLPGVAIDHQHLTIERREPLADELTAFLSSVQTRQAPETGGQEAREALAAALWAARSIAEHSRRVGITRAVPLTDV